MPKTTLRKRIGAGYVLMLSAIVAIVLSSIWVFEATSNDAAMVRREFTPGIQGANLMLRDLAGMGGIETSYLFADTVLGDAFQSFDRLAAEWLKAEGAALEAAERPSERQALEEILLEFGAFRNADAQLHSPSAQFSTNAARRLWLKDARNKREQLEGALRSYRQLELTLVNESQRDASRRSRQALSFAIAVALSGACAGGVAWRNATKDVVAPLVALRAAAAAIADGRFEGVAHPAAQRTVELAALEADFNCMAESLATTTAAVANANMQLESQVEFRTQELENARTRLESMVSELQALDRLKSNFLAVMSHELLTPLNFITAYGSLLADNVLGPLAAEQAAGVEKILDGARRLTRMVRNVLDFAALSDGGLAVRPERVDYRRVVLEALEEIRPEVVSREQDLELACPATLPPVWGDRERLRQVLSELLDNATKFAGSGGKIRVSIAHGASGVRTAIADSGVGIPLEAQAALFKPFFQADGSRTRRHGGIGLGLALTDHLVQRMGGTLTVRSRAGQGATFAFTIAVAPESSKPTGSTPLAVPDHQGAG